MNDPALNGFANNQSVAGRVLSDMASAQSQATKWSNLAPKKRTHN